MEATKFCRACKWARLSLIDRIFLGWSFAKCAHPSADMRCNDNVETEFAATGVLPKQSIARQMYCTISRSTRCGLQAQYWEPRQ